MTIFLHAPMITHGQNIYVSPVSYSPSKAIPSSFKISRKCFSDFKGFATPFSANQKSILYSDPLFLKTVLTAGRYFSRTPVLYLFSSTNLNARIETVRNNCKYLKEIDEVLKPQKKEYRLEQIAEKAIALNEWILLAQKAHVQNVLSENRFIREDLRNISFRMTGAYEELKANSVDLDENQTQALKDLDSLIENGEKLLRLRRFL